MATFLIFLPLAAENSGAFETIMKTATSFLEAQGRVERKSLGLFGRTGRTSKGSEELRLVALESEAQSVNGRDPQVARTLEGVLRSTMAAAGLPCNELRVFVEIDGSGGAGIQRA